MKNLKRSHFIFDRKLEQNDVLNFDLELDQYFGLNLDETEEIISDEREGSYTGIDARALSTSYIDYYKMLSKLPVDKIFVDLGAGHCRGSFLSHELGLIPCVSVEFVYERAKKALNRLGKDLVRLDDLSQENLVRADYYYLYFPKGKVLDYCLKQIIAFQAEIFVCESHGDVQGYLEALGFLELDRFEVSLPRHAPFIKRYKFRKLNHSLCWQDNLPLWMLYNQDKVLVVQYHDSIQMKVQEWAVKIEELEWIQYQGEAALQLLSGRIILVSKDERILRIEESFPSDFELRDGKWLRDPVP